MQGITFVGLDVHKATIAVSLAAAGRDGEVRHWGAWRTGRRWCVGWSNVCGEAATSFGCVTRLGRAVTACTGSSPILAAIVSWWRRPLIRSGKRMSRLGVLAEGEEPGPNTLFSLFQ
jgi:hypothetical protein